MEKHDDLRPRNLKTSIQDQSHDSIKMSFACWNMPRVNVIGLEPREEELTGSNIVAVKEHKKFIADDDLILTCVGLT
jgi:hypothetical protein